MWFKNLRVYKITDVISANVAECLAAHPFHPCGSLDPVRYGFVPVIPEGREYLHHVAVVQAAMLCAKRQEKILPSAAVNEALDEKVRAISEAESRPVGRKERGSLKDEIIFSMLPKALTKSTLEYAYIDIASQLIIVNSSSAKKAEDLLSKLREALGSLRCVPLVPVNTPTQVMTNWVQTGQLPANFELGDSVELRAGKDGRIVRCKNQELDAAEVLNHINSGMFVTKVSLCWRESITFTVDSDLAIKGIKFDDVVAEKANARNPESRAEQFDADFCVMTVELRALLTDFIAAFGGLTPQEVS